MSDTANLKTPTPGDQHSDDFYDAAPPEPLSLYQGEILIDVPVLVMPKPPGWRLLRSYAGPPLREVFENGQNPRSVKVVDGNRFPIEWDGAGNGDYAMGELTKRPALVLSQNCDIETKDFIQIAPIYQADSDKPEYLQRLRDGKIFSVFFLKPRNPTLPGDSFADFERMQAVHKSYIKKLNTDQHFRLKEDRIRFLQRAVTRYFGRPNSYDVGSDKVPERGVYLCVQCFYRDGIATRLPFDAGAEFRECEVCGGRLWVRKAP